MTQQFDAHQDIDEYLNDPQLCNFLMRMAETKGMTIHDVKKWWILKQIEDAKGDLTVRKGFFTPEVLRLTKIALDKRIEYVQKHGWMPHENTHAVSDLEIQQRYRKFVRDLVYLTDKCDDEKIKTELISAIERGCVNMEQVARLLTGDPVTSFELPIE